MYDNLQDLRKYYRDTVVALPEKDHIVPFHISDIIKTDAGVIMARGYTADGEDWKDDVTIRWDRLQLGWPKLGMYNYPDSCVFISRLPVRSHIKGMNSFGLRINNISHQEKVQLYQTLYTFNVSSSRCTYDLFNGKTIMPYDQALHAVRHMNRLSAAFDRLFAVRMSFAQERPILVYKIWDIGTISDNNVITLHLDWLADTVKEKTKCQVNCIQC